MTDSYHRSVLLDEVIEGLDLKRGGIYVDATLGGGGHSRAISDVIGTDGTLLGIDADPDAIAAATERLVGSPAKFVAVNRRFDELTSVLAELGIVQVDGVLYDLGVSSHQLDDPARGFTFRDPLSRLDMRVQQLESVPSASDLLNTMSTAELTTVFRDYGDEKWAARIAEFVVKRRENEPYEFAGQLVETVKAAIPVGARSKDIHPATKVFQALRIAVNDEYGRLQRTLYQAVDALISGGRLLAISFHSGEDRIVKHTLAELAGKCICPPEYPQCICRACSPTIELVTKKPIVPTASEVAENPRARSAKLRIVRKL